VHTFVLIHGAGDSAWFWHLVEPELTTHGHDVVAMDLPCDDDASGLAEYADTVVEAIGDRRDLVLVAQSFGGYTAPLVCERVPVDLMVLVAAMIPSPGEVFADWWTNAGYEESGHAVAAFEHQVFGAREGIEGIQIAAQSVVMYWDEVARP
jgi:pimeloyl-ACP methyl ester carboxylesterase